MLPDPSARRSGRPDPESAADPVAPRSRSSSPKRHGDELMTSAGSDRPATACAIVAFGVTSALAVAAADWPPPVGFLWLEALLATLAVIVYVRVRSRLMARARGRRCMPAAFEGLIAGLVSGLILLLMRSPGEPDITPTSVDNLIGFAVIGIIGAVAAQALWALAVRIDRHPTAPSPAETAYGSSPSAIKRGASPVTTSSGEAQRKLR